MRDMGISKIGALFAANVDSVASQKTPQQPESTATAVTQSSASEAVVLSSSLARSGAVDADPGRAGRIQQLKGQVRSGSYSADSTKVALAVMRDLG